MLEKRVKIESSNSCCSGRRNSRSSTSGLCLQDFTVTCSIVNLSFGFRAFRISMPKNMELLTFCCLKHCLDSDIISRATAFSQLILSPSAHPNVPRFYWDRRYINRLLCLRDIVYYWSLFFAGLFCRLLAYMALFIVAVCFLWDCLYFCDNCYQLLAWRNGNLL